MIQQATEGRERRDFPIGTDANIFPEQERIDMVLPGGAIYSLDFPKNSRFSLKQADGKVWITIDKPTGKRA